ncbi:cystathionine gamma-synthase [Caenispirillum bisanense]|uniref:cystathionine gamma-synthase n=1 Tax=Caenispirillum bisanense TaxID=414052 RepID=UPI0031D49D5F
MSRNDKTGFGTRAIHAGQQPDPTTGAVMTPIYATSTYAQEGPGEHKGWEYSRSGNPTRKAFEDCLADLEGGTKGLAFASGLAAESCILEMLEPGDHVVAVDDLYGGSFRLFERVRRRSMGLDFTYVPADDTAAVEAAIRPDTKLIWIETPTNPLLKIADLAAIAAIARRHGVLTVADNTFCSPYIQRPIEQGIDIVVHSVTKYVNGHSDMVGGAIVIGDRPEVAEKLAFLQNATGGILSPFDSFLVLRGLKTLHLRMERHSSNGQKIAEWLVGRREAEAVFYPGLPDHPGHAIARRQMPGGFGGMISVRLKTDKAGAVRLLKAMKVFTLAESLGGVESLIGHPATMTHASIDPARRADLGITDGLVRLSVGVEDADDLIADLEQAFAVAEIG